MTAPPPPSVLWPIKLVLSSSGDHHLCGHGHTGTPPFVKLGRGDVWTSDVRCHLTTKTHTTKSRKASVCSQDSKFQRPNEKTLKESCQSRIAPGPYFPRVHSRYGGIALRKKGEISIWHKQSVRKHWNLLANDRLETVQWQWSEFVVKSELHSVTRVALRFTIRCVVILALSLFREARRHVKTSVARSHQSTMKHTTGHRKGQGHVWISVARNHHSTEKHTTRHKSEREVVLCSSVQIIPGSAPVTNLLQMHNRSQESKNKSLQLPSGAGVGSLSRPHATIRLVLVIRSSYVARPL